MPEGEHGVGLAAAEVGLQLDDRIAAGAGQAFDRAEEQAFEAFGDEGAAEELGGVFVLVGALVLVDLPEVGGEFGLLVAAGGDVGVRGDDFAPGLESPLRLAFGGCEGGLAHLAAALLFELDAEQVHPHLADVGGLIGGDGGQQALHAVECAVGVVATEGLLVGPLVAHVAELADNAPLGRAERAVEDLVPLVPHHAYEGLGVPAERGGLFGLAAFGRLAFAGGVVPLVGVNGLEFALDEGRKAGRKEVEGLADPFAVG